MKSTHSSTAMYLKTLLDQNPVEYILAKGSRFHYCSLLISRKEE